MIAHLTAVRIVPNSKLALQARDGSWMSISPKSFEARHPQAAPALSPASTSQPQVNMGQCLLRSLTSAPNLPLSTFCVSHCSGKTSPALHAAQHELESMLTYFLAQNHCMQPVYARRKSVLLASAPCCCNPNMPTYPYKTLRYTL